MYGEMEEYMLERLILKAVIPLSTKKKIDGQVN